MRWLLSELKDVFFARTLTQKEINELFRKVQALDPSYASSSLPPDPLALHRAISSENHAQITELLKHPKLDLSIRDTKKRTVLHLACLLEPELGKKKIFREDIVESLLQISSSIINLQDEKGNTALHYAIEQRDVLSCQVLMNNGADSMIYNYDRLPVRPIDQAALYWPEKLLPVVLNPNCRNPQIVEALRPDPISVSQVDTEQVTDDACTETDTTTHGSVRSLSTRAGEYVVLGSDAGYSTDAEEPKTPRYRR